MIAQQCTGVAGKELFLLRVSTRGVYANSLCLSDPANHEIVVGNIVPVGFIKTPTATWVLGWSSNFCLTLLIDDFATKKKLRVMLLGEAELLLNQMDCRKAGAFAVATDDHHFCIDFDQAPDRHVRWLRFVVARQEFAGTSTESHE
jgi:hypothetical protein